MVRRAPAMAAFTEFPLALDSLEPPFFMAGSACCVVVSIFLLASPVGLQVPSVLEQQASSGIMAVVSLSLGLAWVSLPFSFGH